MKIFIYILLLILSCKAGAQLYSISNYYTHDALAINPGFAGSSEALSATIIYRNSIGNFEGAPKTTSISIHTPFNKEKTGLGFLLINDQIGISKETNLSANYAFRIILGKGRLALGLGAAISIQKTNWNKLIAIDQDDTELMNASTSGIIPDFSLGIYYSTQKYFIGLSAPMFLSHDYNTRTEKYIVRNDFSEYNYFLNAGYLFNIAKNIDFIPSFLLKYHTVNGMQIDLNTQFMLKNKIWLGGIYRSENILSGIIQFQFNEQLRAGYSYDFSVKSSGYPCNSHEIILNYIFNYNKVIADPRKF